MRVYAEYITCWMILHAIIVPSSVQTRIQQTNADPFIETNNSTVMITYDDTLVTCTRGGTEGELGLLRNRVPRGECTLAAVEEGECVISGEEGIALCACDGESGGDGDGRAP